MVYETNIKTGKSKIIVDVDYVEMTSDFKKWTDKINNNLIRERKFDKILFDGINIKINDNLEQQFKIHYKFL